MENGKWIQIKASAPVAYLSDVEAVMGMISNSLMTEDYSDIEKDLDGVYGDLIDEELLARDRSTCAVSAFISDSANPAESVSFARGRFDELKIPAQIDVCGVSEEDWADSWKKYYKPIKTGKRVVIVPVWEKYDAAPGEVTVLMDPGMAFTTQRACALNCLKKTLRTVISLPISAAAAESLRLRLRSSAPPMPSRAISTRSRSRWRRRIRF